MMIHNGLTDEALVSDHWARTWWRHQETSSWEDRCLDSENNCQGRPAADDCVLPPLCYHSNITTLAHSSLSYTLASPCRGSLMITHSHQHSASCHIQSSISVVTSVCNLYWNKTTSFIHVCYVIEDGRMHKRMDDVMYSKETVQQIKTDVNSATRKFIYLSIYLIYLFRRQKACDRPLL